MFGVIYGDQAKYFEDEIRPQLKHNKIGVVAMASKGPNLNASQFYITVADRLPALDGKHTIFGEVAEGIDNLLKINESFTDDDGRPLKVVRIRHTVVLHDPFDDPRGLEIPNQSPIPIRDTKMHALEDDADIEEDIPEDELQKRLAEKEARARAEVLTMLGDLPDADVKPPENVLFVCKLNPVTRDSDLELIFSRFGDIKSCEIIRDKRSGESLCYAFVEFATQAQCEEAYFKMNNVLIDDRRIHVDFSQSVSKMVDWKKEGGWKQYFASQAKMRNKDGGKDSGGKGPSRPGGFTALQMRHGGAQRPSRPGPSAGAGYGMLFDETEEDLPRESSSKRQKISEHEHRRHDRDSHRDHGRDRERDRDHGRDRDRDRDRNRDYDRNRDRDSRDYDRSRDRHHYDRDRDRNRDADRYQRR